MGGVTKLVKVKQGQCFGLLDASAQNLQMARRSSIGRRGDVNTVSWECFGKMRVFFSLRCCSLNATCLIFDIFYVIQFLYST